MRLNDDVANPPIAPTAGRRDFLRRAGAAALGFASSSLASAQGTYPDRTVRMVVPLPPGGASDALARLLAERLQARWKQAVVIDNRPGGGTIIGTQAVARAAPDGYTFGMVISAHTINPSLRKNLPFDTIRDFTPLTQIGYSLMALVANAAFPPGNVAELISLARQKPGSIAYASLGIGTATHLAGELLKVRTGIDMTHVPYTGSAPAYNDLLAGNVPIGFVLLDSALPHVKAGKLKVLGLTNGTRSKVYPEIPTIGETVPGYSLVSSLGFLGPKGLPPEVTKKLAGDLISVLGEPDLAKRYSELGVEIVASTPAEYASFIRGDIDKWASIVKASGAKID